MFEPLLLFIPRPKQHQLIEIFKEKSARKIIRKERQRKYASFADALYYGTLKQTLLPNQAARLDIYLSHYQSQTKKKRLGQNYLTP